MQTASGLQVIGLPQNPLLDKLITVASSTGQVKVTPTEGKSEETK